MSHFPRQYYLGPLTQIIYVCVDHPTAFFSYYQVHRHTFSAVYPRLRGLSVPSWGGVGPYRFSVNSIPESIVFRVSFPVHLGRMRFMSIQFLSGGRPVVGKFWFSPGDDPTRWVISNPVSSVCYVIYFQSWSRAPIVTNLGIPASAGVRRDRRRLIRVSQRTQTQSGDGI